MGEETISSKKYVGGFLFLVGILVIVSIVIKVIQLIRTSTFTEQTFTVAVISDKTELLYVDTKEKRVELISIPKKLSPTQSSSIISSQFAIGVPIDSVIKNKNLSLMSLSSKHSYKDVFHLSEYNSSSYLHLNQLDILKIYYFLFFSNYSYHATNFETFFDDVKSEQDIFAIFKDAQIFNDKVSIEIINASDVDGIGSRVGKMLKRIGANVVSTKSLPEQRQSTITSSDNSYTSKRMSRIFLITKVEDNGNKIADITITLGTDFVSKYITP